MSFYEHLVDESPTRREIPVWVKPDIFGVLMGLFEWWLGKEGMRELRENYADKRK